jgi:hypothetical protein
MQSTGKQASVYVGCPTDLIKKARVNSYFFMHLPLRLGWERFVPQTARAHIVCT